MLIMFFLSIHCSSSYCSEQTPDGFVRDFYNWYIDKQRNEHYFPAEDDSIYKYVHVCTVNRLRINMKKRIAGSDYFLKTNDFEYEYFKRTFMVHKSLKINDSLSIVPVGGEKPYAIVFVQKTKDGWRIIKVEDPGVDSDPLWRW